MPDTSNMRETLDGHWLIWPARVQPRDPSHIQTECSCGWLDCSGQTQIEAYARYIWHLSERMYAAIAILDSADKQYTGSHAQAGAIRIRRMVPDGELQPGEEPYYPAGQEAPGSVHKRAEP